MAESIYYSAKELAGLPDMPGTVQRVNEKAKRENWPSRNRQAKGGGKEYPEHCLPKVTQDTLVKKRLKALAPVVAKTEVAPAMPVNLDDSQRQRDGARQLILQFIATAKANKLCLEKAVAALNAGFADGSLHPDLRHAIEHCNDKVNGERVGRLSARSIQRWQTDAKRTTIAYPRKPASRRRGSRFGGCR